MSSSGFTDWMYTPAGATVNKPCWNHITDKRSPECLHTFLRLPTISLLACDHLKQYYNINDIMTIYFFFLLIISQLPGRHLNDNLKSVSNHQLKYIRPMWNYQTINLNLCIRIQIYLKTSAARWEIKRNFCSNNREIKRKRPGDFFYYRCKCFAFDLSPFLISIFKITTCLLHCCPLRTTYL